MAEKKKLVVEYSVQSLNNSIEIVDYLKRKFTQKEIENFYKALANFEKIISSFPTLYSKSDKAKIRRAVLSSVLTVYYINKKNKIVIVAILDNRWDQYKRIKIT